MAGDDGGAQVQGAGVQGLAGDGAVEPQVVDADDVQQAGHAAAGDDVAVYRLVEPVQHGEVGAVHGAVLVDIGADEVPHPQGLHLLGEVHVVHLALLEPALGGHLAVQGVDAHSDALAVAVHRGFDEGRVPESGGAQNHPAHAPVQVVGHGLHIPDAAAHLHLEIGVVHHVEDELGVLGLAVLGAVQVYHMEPAGPLLLEPQGGLQGVPGYHLGGVVVPPEQAHALALVQVDGW